MRRLVLVWLALAPLACSGAQRGSDADWSPEPPMTKERRLRETETLGPTQLDPLESRATALLGVRHDLMLSDHPHPARCSCLAVEVGAVTETNKFFWLNQAPDVGTDALALAIGARGIECPGGDPNDRRRRPSIAAVDVAGDDILIEVEDLPEGRPLATGAIIPMPGPKGSIYVQPGRGNRTYGRGVGTAPCKVR